MTTYDWVLLVVEFLVLAIIAYEAGKAGWRSRQNRRKRAEIYALLGKGHSLQGNPPSIHEIERVAQWNHQVELWISDTRVYLGKQCSPQASLVFLSNMGPLPEPFHMHVDIAPGARQAYSKLLVRLANLTRVLEQADTYY
jgi:hypothetical protein